MAECDEHRAPSTYECVDVSLKDVTSGSSNDNLLFFVRINCDKGGHCPNYDSDKELTCVVCSK